MVDVKIVSLEKIFRYSLTIEQLVAPVLGFSGSGRKIEATAVNARPVGGSDSGSE